MKVPNSLFMVFFFAIIPLLFIESSTAQVGIGTTNPDSSSLLDISSTDKGILTPRMSTAQRNAISEPANGLLVYDVDERAFYYFEEDTDDWVKLNSSLEKRDNFVLVKSEADFPEPEGGVITLDPNTYYEINGTINLSASIDLNGAYISGLDAWEDVLSYNGTMFVGNQGGSIRNIAISGGGTAFDITGGTTFTVQNTIVYQMASVGTISNVGLYFSNIILYYLNTDGITYNNIGSLLLSNQAWFEGNGGTYETFTGTFDQIQKVGGLSTVTSGATGIDVSSNPAVAQGILLGAEFNGNGTLVEGYSGTYPGYFFNNNWSVDTPGLPLEVDAVATGDINLNLPVGSGATTSFTGTGSASRTKLQGNTTSNNLFRFSRGGVNNRLVYEGDRTRYFQVTGSLSYQASTDNTTIVFYIAKNGTVIDQIRVYGRGASGFFVADSGILALSLVGTVQMSTNDYIEVFAERFSGTGNISIVSLNLTVR